jgi:WD40 repeat protein
VGQLGKALQINAVCAVGGVDGVDVVSGGDDRVLQGWDVRSGRCRVIGHHDDWIRAVCELTPGQVATAGQEGVLKLWDVAMGTCLRSLSAHTERVLSCCALHGATARLASGAADGTLRLWESSSGTCVRTISYDVSGRGQDVVVRAVCSLAHGTRVASTGVVPADIGYRARGSILLFDVHTGAQLAQLVGHRSFVQALAALDGTGVRLASGGDDKCVRVWHLPSASCVLVLDGHAGSINALCVLDLTPPEETQGGTRKVRLMSAGADQAARVYEV